MVSIMGPHIPACRHQHSRSCRVRRVLPQASRKQATPSPAPSPATPVSCCAADTALKFGTAWATCYFNAEAEHCDSPLCERMALSVVGGLYVSCAYSNEAESTLAELKDSCNKQDPIPRQPGNNAGTSLADAIDDILNTADDFLPCGSKYQQRTTSSKKKAASSPAAAAVGVAADSFEDYYNGLAVIVSGVFHQTSKHGVNIADNGLLEFTFKFRDGVESQPVNNWPVVIGGGMKLRFTRNDNYYASQN